MKRPDLVGEKFNQLLVLELSNQRDNRNIRKWKCQCECGNIVYATTNALKSNNTKSCGCLQKEKVSQLNKKDLTNQRFGKLVVIKSTDKRINGFQVWECRCDCGNITYVNTNLLTTKKTKSCGCLHKPVISLIGRQFGDWIVIGEDGKHSDGFYYWKCKCKCGTIRTIRGNNLKSGDSTNCGCEKSKGEIYVSNWLKQHNLPFIREYSFNDLYGDKLPLRFDFKVNDKLIEVMGTQHYDNRQWGGPNLAKYDQRKKEYCQKKNILLLYLDYNKDSTIPFDIWDKQLIEFFKEEI